MQFIALSQPPVLLAILHDKTS